MAGLTPIDFNRLRRQTQSRLEQIQQQQSQQIAQARTQLDTISNVQGQRVESPEAELSQINRSQEFFGGLTPTSTGAALTAGILAQQGEQVGRRVDAARSINQGIADQQQNLTNQIDLVKLGVAEQQAETAALRNIGTTLEAEARTEQSRQKTIEAQQTQQARIDAINAQSQLTQTQAQAATPLAGQVVQSEQEAQISQDTLSRQAADTLTESSDGPSLLETQTQAQAEANIAKSGLESLTIEQQAEFALNNPDAYAEARQRQIETERLNIQSAKEKLSNIENQDAQNFANNRIQGAETYNSQLAKGEIEDASDTALEAIRSVSRVNANNANQLYGGGSRSNYQKATNDVNLISNAINQINDNLTGRIAGEEGVLLSSPDEIQRLQNVIGPLYQKVGLINQAIVGAETSEAFQGDVFGLPLRDAGAQEDKDLALQSLSGINAQVNNLSTTISTMTGIDEKLILRAIVRGDDEALREIRDQWFVLPEQGQE